MNKDRLRKCALQIGNVSNDYELEIEDFREEHQIAMFFWKSIHDEEQGIWIELDGEGHLLRYDQDEPRTHHSPIHEDVLLETAIQYVSQHYPDAARTFTAEKTETLSNRKRFSYVQMELGLPLEMTGFYIDVSLSGETIQFRYYGAANDIRLPQETLDKELIKQSFLADVKMNLTITELSPDVYGTVNRSLRLVYEPDCPFRNHPADHLVERNFEDEYEDAYEASYLPLPEKLSGYHDIYEVIGFDAHTFTKLREVDTGDEVVTVWHPNPPLSENNNLSLDGYFQRKTENTLKVRTEKQTGAITGLFNFIKTEGPLSLSIEECRTIALKFLYTLYPNADQYFHIACSNDDEEEETTRHGFHFSIYHKGISTHFGLCHITVNKTTGFVINYMAPDIDVNSLEDIDTQPALSENQAKTLYIEELDFELTWKKNYEENQHEYHELIYRVSFPKYLGDIRFIDAHSGEKIASKI